MSQRSTPLRGTRRNGTGTLDVAEQVSAIGQTGIHELMASSNAGVVAWSGRRRRRAGRVDVPRMLVERRGAIRFAVCPARVQDVLGVLELLVGLPHLVQLGCEPFGQFVAVGGPGLSGDDASRYPFRAFDWQRSSQWLTRIGVLGSDACRINSKPIAVEPGCRRLGQVGSQVTLP